MVFGRGRQGQGRQFAIFVDDMADTCRTICHAAEK